jgi:predicted Rdx family selenoprotein
VTGSAGTETPSGGTFDPGKVIPDPEEEYYVLNSVFFDFDNYSLSDSARREVDRIYEVMNRYPDLRLEVTGHTDARGNADYNLALSERRADAVANYLIQKGIDPDRLISRGLGESAPIAMDFLEDGTDSPEGRRLNRHVDLRLHNLSHPNIKVADVFVPSHLRPKKDYSYSVLLVQSETFLDTLPDEVNGEEVSMIIAGQNYLYTAGNFNNRIDAVKLLNHVIDSGFPEAQMFEKRQLEQLVADLIEGEVPPVITFTIQFMALKNPVPVTYFKDLEAVSRFEGNDGLTRYVTGEYKEIDEAFDELRMVREKGYHDAFIMYLARYRRSGHQ